MCQRVPKIYCTIIIPRKQRDGKLLWISSSIEKTHGYASYNKTSPFGEVLCIDR